MSQNITLGNDLITVHYCKGLPDKFFGCVCKKSAHEHIIIINSDLPEAVQAEALEHQIRHIERRDLDADYVDVDQIEKEVHREIFLRKEV